MTETGIWFRLHAVQRMFERDVSVKNVVGAMMHGETIEDYSDEMPEPGRLILGYQGRRPFHVVASGDQAAHESIVITVYLPTRENWKKDLRTRRP